MELFETSELFQNPARANTNERKVMMEIHRLQGLLRFTPIKTESETLYIARCSPKHFVLTMLANHFWERFGKDPAISWAIIDEKRNFVLSSKNGKKPALFRIDSQTLSDTIHSTQNTIDEWESLWKHYHRSINNKDRENPALQKQFIPRRFWKYLPEMD